MTQLVAPDHESAAAVAHALPTRSLDGVAALTILAPAAIGTAKGGFDDPLRTDWRWVVVKARCGEEALAAQAIAAREVEPYLPLLPGRRPGGQTGGQPVVLFPGYLFARVRLGSDDVLRIRSAPGISYLLPRDCPPTLLPDSLVEALRTRAASCAGQRGQHLRKGDRVVITHGPFSRLQAVFDSRLSAAGRVRILLDFVHRTVVADIEECQLRRVS